MQCVTNELVRARVVWAWEMKGGGNAETSMRQLGGSCQTDGVGDGMGKWRKEIGGTSHATRECEEGNRMWEGSLGCTRVNGLKRYTNTVPITRKKEI